MIAVTALAVVGALVVALIAMGNRNDKTDEVPTVGATVLPSSEPTGGVTPSAAPASPSATPTAPSPTPSVPPVTPPAEPGETPAAPSTPVIPGAVAVVTLASYDAGAGVVTVGGFVSGLMEDGGACTFTVTAADTGATATFDTAGSMNVDSTTCGSHEIGAPNSSSKSFSVTLTYVNGVGAVTSSTTPVEGS